MGQLNKPWIVKHIESTNDKFYPYRLVVENHCYDPPEINIWRVPNLDHTFYDLSEFPEVEVIRN